MPNTGLRLPLLLRLWRSHMSALVQQCLCSCPPMSAPLHRCLCSPTDVSALFQRLRPAHCATCAASMYPSKSHSQFLLSNPLRAGNIDIFVQTIPLWVFGSCWKKHWLVEPSMFSFCLRQQCCHSISPWYRSMVGTRRIEKLPSAE